MRKAPASVLASCLVFALLTAFAARAGSAVPPVPQLPDQPVFQPYSAEQLDNLLAPIALYPDPLLAQVLVAATFTDQIDEAARWVRAYGQIGIDEQPWDVSVKAVAHYPSILYMMADDLDWTAAVGQAYVYQSVEVMASIQRLRAMANAQGNLVTTPQQQVLVDYPYILIVPAQPRYIFVPFYDPALIFFRRAYGPSGVFVAVSFGPAFVIGAWLNRDCDWRRHRIYYTGWRGGGWIGRSKPYVRITSVYVNIGFQTVLVNRTVLRRPVNYFGINRYNSVHRNVNFNNRMRGVPIPPPPEVRNKIIDRNIRTYDPVLNRYRGRVAPPAPARPPAQPPARPTPPAVQPPKPTPPRTQPPRPAPAQRAPVTPSRRPPPRQQSGPRAFGVGSGDGFNARTASQRGQASRAQQEKGPPASSRPAPNRQPRQERR